MKNPDCIFCKIIDGKIPAEKIYEDENCLVVLDKFPAVKGQGLVLAKEHVPYFTELDDTTLSHLTKISKRIAKAMDKSLNAIRTCLFIEGFEVPHVHIKLYPVQKGKSLDVKKTALASDEELKKTAEKIKKSL